MRGHHLLCLALAAVVSAPVSAVIMRDDVPASTYAERAQRFPTYCRLGLPDGGGALIAPSWVLTAAHLAPDIKVGHRIMCGSESLTVAAVTAHPAYDDNVGRHDLALIRLAQPSRQQPVKLWSNAISSGTIIEIIGHYQGGTGATGGVGRTPAGLRAGTNKVAQADSHWLRLPMDRPKSADTTSFEAVSGAGDSGAPAFIVREGRPYVVGVGSRSLDSNKDGVEQDYGDTDLYVPVSSYANWIDRVERGRENAMWRALDRRAEYGSAGTLLTGVAVLAVLVLAGLFLALRRKRA